MSRILIDTDILIDSLRGNPLAQTELQNIGIQHEALCSAITVGEIIAGMRAGEKEKTYALINSLVVMPVTFEIAELAGQFKNRYQSRSLKLDDCLIAATCSLEANLLHTHNKKHYPMEEIQFF